VVVVNSREAVLIAKDILFEFGLHDWRVELDRAVRRFGQCRYQTKTIGLSRALVELNDRSQVEDTIRHEVAHALAGPEAGHGNVWKRTALAVGARPERCYSSAQVVAAPAPWFLLCEGCGFTATRHRRTRGLFGCPDCHKILRWIRTA
jgi:predicted SprT family Zn-dependent metalloprotease